VSLTAPFRPLFRAQTYRDLLFLAVGIPIAAAVLGLLIAGWTAIAVLAVTPLVVPVLIGYRGAVGLLARIDAAVAEELLGVRAAAPISSGGRGFWGRAKAVLVDPRFWKQQTYLVIRMTLGFALAVGELSLVAGSLGWIAFPVWYRWSDLHFGSWQVDTLGRSFVVVPAGIVALLLAGHLARLFGAVSGQLAAALLDGGPAPRRAVGALGSARRHALSLHAAGSGCVALIQVVIWALTTRGYFWPEWVILPLALVLAVHGWVELVEERLPVDGRVTRGLAIHAGASSALFAFLTLVWAVTTRAYFWPVWVLLGLVLPLGLHLALDRAGRRSRLARRVEALELTRAGAVEAQDDELRRIERDLHDGAQARLVALGMSLGMAEQKLGTDPARARELLAEARAGVADALRELRDLARGVYPPVLTDRGLEAALRSLADRSALPASVSVSLEARPAPRIEAAAYFVAAEALANAAKHSGARRVAIAVARRDGVLEVEVVDDGAGGADPAGSGLVGLRRRVEALDGTLSVTSPPGGPTIVRAELPCAS
jgi:signal transduction histidine kinase